MARLVYMDSHATTPVDGRVFEAMRPHFIERFGNPGSRQYRLGWEAAEAVERARRQVADLVGASAKDIVFTSGATESNNLALKGAALALQGARDRIVTVATEHKAVLDPCRRLEGLGWHVTRLPVNHEGLVDLARVEEAVTDRTALVSVMAANNEIGVLQPLREIAAIAHARGALVHTDAVQAAGRVPFDVDDVDADLASVTAHKLYGPKGVGALYVRRRPRRVALEPIIEGGGQERGLRSGTLNVPGIVGFGAAAAIAREELPVEGARLARLRDRLLDRLVASLDGLTVNGARAPRLPGNLNVSIAGIDGEALLVSLDDVAVSSGAACAASEPSHVLTAIGRPPALALASVRFGLCRDTSEEDVDYVAARVVEVVSRLRALSPVRG